MANDVARLWQGVLDGLNTMVGADNHAAARRVDELVKKIASSQQQSKATWKQLLGDMQVRGPG
jgi:hypothetical protein